MSEKIDRKLGGVKLAEYQYRHEAEFAAGFLDEAGIPYRLQLDDPALGMTVGVPATLWVRGMDERAAREILDLPARPADAPREDDSPPGSAARSPRRLAGEREASALVRERSLTEFERLLALALFIGCLGLAPVALAAPAAPLWIALLAALGGALAVGALSGRTVGLVRRLLRAISGSAP